MRIPMLVALTLVACSVERGSGVAATEERELDPIESVDLSTFLDVDVRVGADLHNIEITCDDNLLELIESEVVDGHLTLEMKDGTLAQPKVDCSAILKVGALHEIGVSGSGEIDVVTGVVDDLESVRVSGSGSVHIEEANGCDISLRTSGSGSILVDTLEACSVDVAVSGSGSTALAGSADELTARISGSGSVNAREVPVTHVDARISGSGDAAVQATESAVLRISGSGDVLLSGGALDVDVDVSGSGRVLIEE